MKWKFLLCILLKICFSYSQTATPALGSNQKSSEKSNDSSKIGCYIPFHKYELGKRFYFPKTQEKGDSPKRVRGYEFIAENNKEEQEVFYDTLSDKTFTLDKIHDQYIRDKRNRIIDFPYYLLKSKDGLAIKYHYNFPNLRNLKNEEIKVHYILPEAVYLDEVDNFKRKYLNTGRELYAVFPINKKKYRKITIVDISPGSKDKPIHIAFSFPDVKIKTEGGIEKKENTVVNDSKDVCDCGTNVLPVLIPNCNFESFFTIKDPKDGLTEIDLYWDFIMEGKIVPGMNKDHVIKALGAPLKTATELKKTADEKTEIITMTYKNGVIVLENNKVKSAQKTE